MSCRGLLAGAVPLLAAALAALPGAADQPRAPRKMAILVGPSTYLHDFRPLKYAAADVTALADVLREGGFDEVVVLTDPPEGKAPATRGNVLAQL